MVWLDCTNNDTLAILLIFFVIMNIIAIASKKAAYTMATVLLSISMFVLQVINKDAFTPKILKVNVMIDFASLAVSIPILLIIDEIEMRRSVIKNVFHKKYGRRK